MFGDLQVPLGLMNHFWKSFRFLLAERNGLLGLIESSEALAADLFLLPTLTRVKEVLRLTQCFYAAYRHVSR